MEPFAPGPRPRPTVAVVAAAAGVGLALVAALVAPAVLDAPAAPAASTPSEPAPVPSRSAPATPASPKARDTTGLETALRALPGVTDARVADAGTSLSAELVLATPLPAPDVAQQTADDARALLDAQGSWSLRTTATTPGGATLQVTADTAAARGSDPTTGEQLPDLLGDDPVAYAVRLLGDDSVRAVTLATDNASVEVATADDLVPVAGLVRAEGRGVTGLVVTGYGVGTYGGDGTTVPDDALLALVADTSARPGVVQVAYEEHRDTLPDAALLTVVTGGDPAPVARRLGDLPYAGTALAYQVQGTGPDGATVTRSGTLAGADDPAPAAPQDACTADDVEITAGGLDAAAGRRFLTLTARNVGSGPADACALAGPPGLRFLASDGAESDVLLEPETEPGAGGPLTLAPGATASATLTWRGGATSGGAPRVTSLLVSPHPGDDTVVVPLAGIEGVSEGLDLLGGGSAQIGPWTPAAP